MTEEDYNTIQRMEALGGNFVQNLARAFTAGDDDNRHKIRAAFSDLFDEYSDNGEFAKYCPACKRWTGEYVKMPPTAGFIDGRMWRCEDCERQWGHG